MTVTIPWVPPTLNKMLRSHWSKRKKDLQTVSIYLAGAGISRPRERESRKIRVAVQIYRKNPTDRDGNQGSCKVIFDSIVRLGLARDDSEKWMEQVVLPVIVDRKNPRTEISIEIVQ